MAPPKNKVFTFKYVKAPDFKTVSIDGVFGGLTGKRDINLTFFIEAPDFPKSVLHEILALNKIGKALQPEVLPPSAIREMPFAVNIDIQTAKQLVVFLNEKIKEGERQNKEIIEEEFNKPNPIKST